MGKKSKYFKSKGSKSSVPPKGSKGILVTCDISNVNRAVSQVVSLCHSLVPEDLLENQDSNNNEKSLEDEISELRNEKTKARFVPYVSDVSGNFFIRFVEPQDDPFDFLSRYFTSIKLTGKSETPKAVRLYPVQYTGFPEIDESFPILTTLVQPVFENKDFPLNYEVVIHRKHAADKDSHDILNNKIISFVGPPHKPMYHNADIAIVWISLGRNLFLSVIPKWKEWCNCNIPKLCAQKNINIQDHSSDLTSGDLSETPQSVVPSSD